MSKPGLLTLTIKDKSALYLAYKPFIENGGLFIPTSSQYKLGDEVFMLLSLMEEAERLPVARMTCFASIVSSPSAVSTTTLPGPARRPWPS